VNQMNKKILIVDEDELVRRVVRLHLEREGWIGIEAENGEKALEILGDESMAVILFDCKMSGMDSITFFNHIKQRAITVPVIVLLVFLDMEKVSEVMRMGAFDYLTKPIQRENLILSVNRGVAFQNLADEYVRLKEENQKYQQNLEQVETVYLELVKTLAEAIETKDAYTRGHCERVPEVSLNIAKTMGLSLHQIRDILLAGILHDVGKIGIPEGILTKPGPLDQREWEVIQEHPDLGLNIIQHVGFLGEAREIIAQHHERFDGTGYPKGLQGEAIHLGARILAVADSYDAMSSERPYHLAMNKEKIMDEIHKQAGLQFDPRVVEIFLTLLAQEGKKN
jgi:putative two-component system response regulator